MTGVCVCVCVYVCEKILSGGVCVTDRFEKSENSIKSRECLFQSKSGSEILACTMIDIQRVIHRTFPNLILIIFAPGNKE